MVNANFITRELGRLDGHILNEVLALRPRAADVVEVRQRLREPNEELEASTPSPLVDAILGIIASVPDEDDAEDDVEGWI